MSVLPNCWDNIIGITRNTECLDKYGKPTDYNTSLSGLFLDELKGINLKFVEATGGVLWDKLSTSYDSAVRAFKMDAIKELLELNKTRYDKFEGNIGSQRFTRSLTLAKTYAGVRMYCNDVKGAVFTLKAIGVLMDKTETFDIDIYNNLNNDIIESIEVSSIANKINIINLVTPLQFDLSDANYDNLEYSFLYTIGTKQPKDNKPTCGCGGVNWCFNRSHPCFADGKATKDRWRQFAMIGGISGDDIAIREEWGSTQEMNGIVLIGEFECNKFIYLCNEETDYENDEIGQAIAFALLYKWGEYTMDFFLDTKEISRYTTLGLDAINNLRVFYNERYAVMIDFIVKNLDVSKYGCLSCKPAHGAKFNRQLL